jgi:hypothetical protein
LYIVERKAGAEEVRLCWRLAVELPSLRSHQSSDKAHGASIYQGNDKFERIWLGDKTDSAELNSFESRTTGHHMRNRQRIVMHRLH